MKTHIKNLFLALALFAGVHQAAAQLPVNNLLQPEWGIGHALPESLAAKKFSGKFVLRLEPIIHRRLAAKALAAAESLNSYCVKTLVKA
jgi:HicB family